VREPTAAHAVVELQETLRSRAEEVVAGADIL
jgi:hypothetical protein